MKDDTKNFIYWLLGGAAIVVFFIYSLIAINPSSQVVIDDATAGVIQADDWVKGNPDSRVQIIEYSDFECPACASVYADIVKPILAEYSSHVAFAYRHFPLKSIHDNAVPAAMAAEAAGIQSKFFEMHNKLFENQNVWSDLQDPQKEFIKYATELNLDIDKFKDDYSSSSITKKVEDAYQYASGIGLGSTPTFFLNGEHIQLRSLDDFRMQIREAIDAQS